MGKAKLIIEVLKFFVFLVNDYDRVTKLREQCSRRPSESVFSYLTDRLRAERVQ